MIIWLASFPRSGNTLLRTVLKQTMGLGSFNDDLMKIRFTEAATEEIGHLPMAEPWESFYESASASKALHLVKTHRPPRDDQRAIYVVRDGRRSLVSYQKYHEKFLGEQALSQMALVMGSDYYGDWSEHYQDWVSSGRNTLLVRYEELVNAAPDLLRTIAKFIGYQGPISEWTNPFGELHQENPDFFRVGEARWQGAPGWSELINSVFFYLHGDLMNALGYADKATLEAARATFASDVFELVQTARSIRTQQKTFEKICRERLAVIHVLDAEVKRLSSINSKPGHKR